MRAGPGCEGTHETLELGGGLLPVEFAVGAGEFAHVGDEGVVLLFARRIAGGDEVERGLERAGGQQSELVMQTAAGVVGGDGQRVLEEHVAGVEALIHEHDGDAGLAIAIANGGLDGRGAAMTWKERCVDVQAAERWHVEHRTRQNLAVGDDDGDVGTEGLQFIDGVADFQRLKNAQAGFFGTHFDLWRREHLLAAHGLVRLRDDADDFVLGCVEQPFQGGKADVSGADEEDAH